MTTTPPPIATIPERVAAGAAWLDEHRPGWAAEIDLAILDIESSCRCILGQLYGDFYDAPLPNDEDDEDIARGKDLSAAPLGFGISSDPATAPYEEITIEIDALTAEWRRIIAERRA